jgi:hypothetical protein
MKTIKHGIDYVGSFALAIPLSALLQRVIQGDNPNVPGGFLIGAGTYIVCYYVVSLARILLWPCDCELVPTERGEGE